MGNQHFAPASSLGPTSRLRGVISSGAAFHPGFPGGSQARDALHARGSQARDALHARNYIPNPETEKKEVASKCELSEAASYLRTRLRSPRPRAPPSSAPSSAHHRRRDRRRPRHRAPRPGRQGCVYGSRAAAATPEMTPGPGVIAC
jgi:hypothetical protein